VRVFKVFRDVCFPFLGGGAVKSLGSRAMRSQLGKQGYEKCGVDGTVWD